MQVPFITIVAVTVEYLSYNELLIVKSKVAVESQPAALVPNQYKHLKMYMSDHSKYMYHRQSDCSSRCTALLIVKFNVAVESHPAALVPDQV